MTTDNLPANLWAQEDFWSAHPCGADGTFADRARFRYAMEPWLEPLIRKVGANHRRILEIGCGQAIDGYQLAAAMPVGGCYVGVDYSAESVRAAEAMRPEATQRLGLSVSPEFRVGSALALDLPNASFDCVFSIGVMHHTPSVEACVAEALRVLEPGGVAYIALYRKYSLKVTVAKALRLAQRGTDWIVGGDRIIYRALQKHGRSKIFGTMFLECFGVPYMGWYSRAEMMQLFSAYDVLSLVPVGYNLFWPKTGEARENRFGYMWLVEARKPGAQPADA
jgi:ubiquinone/menaquinone biosynthesis C-methylase UbiE